MQAGHAGEQPHGEGGKAGEEQAAAIQNPAHAIGRSYHQPEQQLNVPQQSVIVRQTSAPPTSDSESVPGDSARRTPKCHERDVVRMHSGVRFDAPAKVRAAPGAEAIAARQPPHDLYINGRYWILR